MDYFKVFTDSIKLWWNNKYLWLLGIIAVIFGGTSGSGSSSSFNNSFSKDIQDNPFSKINFDFSAPIIIILIFLFILILLFLLLGIYLKSRADASLIASVPLLEKNSKLNFSGSWKLGDKNWFKLFLIRLIISIPLIIFSLLILVVVVFGFVTLSRTSNTGILPLAAIILVPFACLAAIYAVITSILYTFASRIAIIKEHTAWESIKLSWIYFCNNFSKLIVFWLISLLVGIVVGPITLIIGFTLFLPLLAIIIPLAIANGLLAIILGVLSLIFIGAVLSLLSGPVYSFTEVYWTKVYLILQK